MDKYAIYTYHFIDAPVVGNCFESEHVCLRQGILEQQQLSGVQWDKEDNL